MHQKDKQVSSNNLFGVGGSVRSIGVYNTFDKRMNEDSVEVRPAKARVDEFGFSLPNARRLM